MVVEPGGKGRTPTKKEMVNMALRQAFSLINSEFNDFLFASVGDEGNGMTLSVFSALVRLDIDPWREAARLAALSNEGAAQAFARTLARLPGGRWALANTQEIAARLVAFLPRHRIIAMTTSRDAGKAKSSPIFLMICLMLFVAASLVIGVHHESPPSGANTSTEIPGTTGRP
jgi:hypothetical protein